MPLLWNKTQNGKRTLERLGTELQHMWKEKPLRQDVQNTGQSRQNK